MIKNDLSNDVLMDEGLERYWKKEILESQAELISVDMPHETMIKVLRVSLRTFVSHKHLLTQIGPDQENKAFTQIAKSIRSNLNLAVKQVSNWQIIIGRSYGCLVTHESSLYLFFKFAGVWFTIFSSN